MAIDLSQATENLTADQSDLAALLPGFPDPGENKDSKVLLTLGFTVTNIREKIDASLADADLLGWFIKFGSKQPDGTINSTQQIASLEIMELFVRGPLGGARDLKTGSLSGVSFVPHLLSQKSTPDQAVRDTDYYSALAKTDLVTNPVSAAPCALLTHHTPWAEAVFFRRSDLRFLRMYLSTYPSTYNDILFTGAKVNYDIMHDPPLRNNQFTLVGGPLNGMVPDSSKAFTLKAEPFRNPSVSFEPLPTGVPPVANQGDLPENDGGIIPENIEFDNGAPGKKSSAPFPVTAMGSPCPDYWEIMEEVIEKMGTVSEMEFSAILTSLNDEFSDQGISGDTQEALSLSTGRSDWIISLLNFLINLLTRWRDGRL